MRVPAKPGFYPIDMGPVFRLDLYLRHLELRHDAADLEQRIGDNTMRKHELKSEQICYCIGAAVVDIVRMGFTLASWFAGASVVRTIIWVCS